MCYAVMSAKDYQRLRLEFNLLNFALTIFSGPLKREHKSAQDCDATFAEMQGVAHTKKLSHLFIGH